MALKYTPEPGAPMDTDLPARSATVLMLALVVTICTCSMYRAATVEKPSTLLSNRLVPL